MSEERRHRRNRDHNRFVTFQGYLDGEGPEKDQIEVRTHVLNITLRQRVKQNAAENEDDWYDFQVVDHGIIYHVDEKTFRRLLSCFSSKNS